VSAFDWDSTGPPEKKRPDGGQAIRAKQQARTCERAFRENTLLARGVATLQKGDASSLPRFIRQRIWGEAG
jgi:hypothetical protein